MLALTECLAAELADVGEQLPDGFREMAKRLDDVEARHPDRLRYARVRSKAQALQHSFPEPVVLALGKTQDAIEALFETQLRWRDVDHANSDASTLVERLMFDAMCNQQALQGLAPGSYP